MKEKVLREFKNGIYPILLFVFSVFVNRSLTFDSHSLGVSMQEFANTFPSYEGVLQPQRILLPFIGFLTKLNLQFINLIFLFIFLYLIYSHMITYQSRFNSLIVCLSISSTMVVQFHLNFGAYPDILSYLLLLLVYKFKNNKFSPYLLFFLALLTKETAIFTFLFFISLRQISKIKLIYLSYHMCLFICI